MSKSLQCRTVQELIRQLRSWIKLRDRMWALGGGLSLVGLASPLLLLRLRLTESELKVFGFLVTLTTLTGLMVMVLSRVRAPAEWNTISDLGDSHELVALSALLDLVSPIQNTVPRPIRTAILRIADVVPSRDVELLGADPNARLRRIRAEFNADQCQRKS